MAENPATSSGRDASARRLVIAMLVLALIAGAALRLSGIASRELSADEAASWAAAVAPTASQVARLQGRFNPGKLPVYELVMHYWIGAFGDGVVAMRVVSSAFGTIAILLVFLVARELFQPGPGSTYSACGRDTIAAVSALVFAVNLVTIKYSREARVYPLQLALILAQIGFFLRAERRGGWMNWAGVVLLTAFAMAANFTAALVLGSEGLWLLYLWALRVRQGDAAGLRIPLRGIVALGLGLALLAPFVPIVMQATPEHRLWGWIPLPPWWEPFAFFNKATGSFAFPLMLALAIWGGWCGWSRARQAVEFMLVWMIAPVIAMMAISYAVRPAFVERYALSCFVPFFVLVALGIWELRSDRARLTALGLAVALALGHVVAHDAEPHDYQWREAAETTSATIGAGGIISVAPPYAVHVVRYYLPPDERASVVGASDRGAPAALLILSHQDARVQHKNLRRQYRHVRAELRGLLVLER